MLSTPESKVVATDQAIDAAVKNREKLLSVVSSIDSELSSDLSRALSASPITMGELFPYFLIEFGSGPVTIVNDNFAVPWSALAHYTSWVDDIDDHEKGFQKPKQIVLTTLFQYAITRITGFVGAENELLVQSAFQEAIRGQVASFRRAEDVESVIAGLKERNSIMILAGRGLDVDLRTDDGRYQRIAEECRLPLQLLDDLQDFWLDLETGQSSLLTYLVHDYFGNVELEGLNRKEVLDAVVGSQCYEKVLEILEDCLARVLLVDGVDPQSHSGAAITSRLNTARWLRKQFSGLGSIRLPDARRKIAEELIEHTYEISASS